MDALALFGTDDPALPARQIAAGALSVTIAPGGVGAVHWGGVEVLRAAQALVRDTDWGTLPEEGASDEIVESPGSFRLIRRFAVAGGQVAGQITIGATAGPQGAELTLDLLLDPVARTRTNRAGFVVLHPAALAGTAVRVRRPDGQLTAGRFPLTISPAQPFRDIAGLDWDAGPVRAVLDFTGEVFEMEDQRNWSDGSFKTYCRPLRLPWPYDLLPGLPVRQGLRLQIAGAPPVADAQSAAPRLRIGPILGTMPDMFLAEQPDWTPPKDATLPPVQGRRLRIDLTGTVPFGLRLTGAGDEVELILPDDAGAARRALDALAATGLSPARIAAVPAAFMISHQPDAIWPAGLQPDQALSLAARAFPRAAPMGGMLTYFTELNRCPAAAQAGDSLTFGTAAIVHDAGDTAVLQTLQALPAIFRSAAGLAGGPTGGPTGGANGGPKEGRPLRLGLVAIGMRSNPYGAGLSPNPRGQRRTMTADDPRHRAAFGAAFALGAVAATEGSAVQSLCLGATGGPFGIADAGGLTPLGRLIAILAAEAGRPRHAVSAPPGLAAVASDHVLVLANLGPSPCEPGVAGQPALGPFEVRVIERNAG